MTAFYNEHDPYAAQFLRNLISAGLIAPGVVDERDIQDIEPWELIGFTQVHMFAGIGIWSGALRAAGWPDDEAIWTGSAPCQPFSNAGKQKGFSDERHLWPVWRNLVAECRPPAIVGEQVASKVGRIWLDTVSADLEALGFAFGASDLCAAGFGGAHIRQRNYFVGLADTERNGRRADEPGRVADQRTVDGWTGANVRLADRDSAGASTHTGNAGKVRGVSQAECQPGHRTSLFGGNGGSYGLADRDNAGSQGRAGVPKCGDQCTSRAGGLDGGMGNAAHGDRGSRERGAKTGIGEDGERRRGLAGASTGITNFPSLYSRQTGSLDDADWLLCRNPAGEPSWRPVEPGTFPLAHGIDARVGKLRAYGNGLDFETAKNFCEVVAEICIGL